MRKAAVLVFFTTFILLFSSISMVNSALTWSDPVNVSTTGRSPSLAVDDSGVVHIAWGSTLTDQDSSELWYANNATGTFTLTQITSNSISDGNPSLALDSLGNVHIVWEGNYSAGNERDIYYINNIGGTFGSIITVSDDDNDERNPQIAIDSNDKAHIVWQYNHGTTDIRYATNAIGAADSFMVLSVTDNFVADDWPQIAIDSNDVIHVVWSGYISSGGYWEILYGNSSSQFPITNPINVSQNGEPWDYYPSLDLDVNDNVHVAWRLDEVFEFLMIQGANPEIVYSNNIGGTFAPSTKVSNNIITDTTPSLVVDNDGDAHVLWYAYSPYEVWYANNTDGSFPTPQNVSRSSSNIEKSPDLFIDSQGFLHAAWFAEAQGVYYCGTLDQVSAPPSVSEFGIVTVLMIAVTSFIILLIAYRKKRKL